ncbi:hypothetical protein [Anaerococcus provencensis]|uniref:hypothetical protein n=1 Tax=Anaerococcus provencensis TaxID=938293 RepID=UPI0002DBBE7E|nr:hypothetical protein [Anaerococcus provencensis]
MEQLLPLGIKLTEAAIRNSATKVYDKVQVAKLKENKEETISILEEQINLLINDKNEIEGIARQYQEMYEKTSVSEDDIAYIKKSFDQMLSILGIEDNEEQNEALDTLKNLISKETMKTLQLLGYNFKEGIGIPLTELTSSKIRSYIPENNSPKNNSKRNRNK